MHTRQRESLIMERMYNYEGTEVTQRVARNKTKLVETKEEAVKLTERIGYFYVVYNNKRDIIGYGIPK